MNRFVTGPIAAYFFDHQEIQMLQFDSLSKFELALLVDYVLAIQAFGPMDVSVVRTYDRLTRLATRFNVNTDNGTGDSIAQ